MAGATCMLTGQNRLSGLADNLWVLSNRTICEY